MIGGCLKSVGCLVVAGVLAVGGWISRDIWLPRLNGGAESGALAWEDLSDRSSPRAEAALASLGRKAGPVYATFSAAEMGTLLLANSAGTSSAVRGARAAIDGDRLLVKASVDLRALKSLRGLGPLASVISGRQEVTITGVPAVIRPGVGEFRVTEVKVGELLVPGQLVPQVLSQLSGTGATTGGSPSALTYALPKFIGDVRVARGKVTLYKAVS